MSIRRTSSFVSALVALVLAVSPSEAHACSFDESTVFVSTYVPDTPAARYVAGELGVLQPTWIRAYLVVAYRQLAGLPLTPGEQAAVLAYLEGPKPSGAGLEAWKSARDAAAGAGGPSIEPERPAGYATYVNCGDDAFRLAAATLEAYVKARGAASPETRGWIASQDAVFSNCGGTTPNVPEPLPASAPAALRADRAYQIAAARFYAGRLEDAQRGFEEIENDTSSPWREIAPYLAARAVLRQATLGAGDEAANRRLLAEARTRFRAVRDGAKTPELRRWAVGLLNFVELRLVTDSSVSATAARVLAPKYEEEFAVSFVHYRDLLFRVLGWGPDPGAYVPDAEDDLTSWIVAFQDNSPRGLERALAGFSRKPSLPWIAAVLSKIPASHPRAAEVVAAAQALHAGGPGGLHVAYHLARLATEAGRLAEARALVRASLPAAESAGASARNLFLELKARNAATFEEFAAAAPRRIVAPEWADAEEMRFDDFTREFLNWRLPLDALVRFLRTAPLGEKATVSMRRVVLTRAILLGRADVARLLAPPGAKVRWDASDWRVDATLAILVEDSESRWYVALDPPFSIAWWCALPGPFDGGREPAFLTAAERRAAADEVTRLAAEPSAATWFCREALAFAKEKPDDPRAPELLARAVRTTREGCADGETRRLSKAAFEALHRAYPKSPFAGQTKYWFEGRGWYPPAPKAAPPPS